eukprot:CAMPEP_0175855590 /NCGR_PEP_ID=MMETSP0107_2-20121207/28010_1 /TAXON_ID=195067 ORGANISM="Goniomonas pacifica, Strain CCMP1869" /NCGR_SAMPLE_ID=MMETSP0107_2 /ASSEMBLY_ACC=CAM_ASM_000203 /LENGTH=127 /DNA_ID=CAMNT_0017171567 /DNA_START=149 /DNA_END=532 /DNA_ORIENTATION=+
MKGKLRCHSGKGEQKRLSVSNSGEGGEPSGEGRGVGQTGKARRMLCPEKAGGEDAGARRGENEGDCCMVCGADSAGLVAPVEGTVFAYTGVCPHNQGERFKTRRGNEGGEMRTKNGGTEERGRRMAL